ncbi:AAA family ATPase [Acinetobacter towneri]|uniref:AAA family ATPase n=1 Tax=Acinetobacter towneri TaxID=202956 RepID=UPI002577E34F|nr:AAA family ATPase [Acinetobacter towneri]MDM1486980.1 AAA family ATPase [Acinetobacter towneri]
MKILRLSLKNLASLAGTHVINFEDDPLAHAGLIAITGKTGAGKSTLLDAMCLALYDEIPRLRGASGSLTDAAGKEISLKDSKHILRRGTTSGFAELEFIALDQKRYAARWNIRRAHNKLDGNLKVERAITCLDEQRVLNQKISEATPLVEKLIGLSFEQFTRAVLLAQSEVGAFLKAKDHERADLLEYLTNSQIFTEVSKLAATKFSDIKQKRAALESVMGHVTLLSDDALKSLETQQHELSQQVTLLSQTEKLYENDLKWHRDRQELYASTQAKKEVYNVQVNADLQLAAQKQLLQQLDEFQSIREQFVLRQQSEAELNTLNLQLADFQPTLQQAEHAQQQAITQQHQAEKNLQTWQQHFAQLKPELDTAAQLQHEISSKLQQYTTLDEEQKSFEKQQIQPVQNDLNTLEQQLVQQQKQQQHLAEQLQHTAEWSIFDETLPLTVQRLQDYLQFEQQLRQQNPKLFQASIDALIDQQQQALQQVAVWEQQYQNHEQLEQQLYTDQQHLQQSSKHLHVLAQLKQTLEQWQQYASSFAQLQSRQQETLSLQKQTQAQIQTQQQQLLIAEQTLQQLQQVFEQQRLLQHQSVQDLRAQLKPNEACMVCGSPEHPFIQHESLLSEALNQLQDQQLQHAKTEYVQAQKQLQQLERDSTQFEVTYAQQQQRGLELQQQIEQQQTLTQQLTASLSFTLDTAFPIADQIEKVQQQWVATDQSTQQLQQAIQQASDTLKQWRSTTQQAEQLKYTIQQRQDLTQRLQTIVADLSTAQQQTWLNQPHDYYQNALQHLLQRQALHQQQDAQFKVLEQLNQQQQQLQQKHSFLVQQLQDKKQQLQQIKAEGISLRDQIKQLTQNYAGQAYQTYQEWQQALDQEQQQLNIALDTQRHALNQTEQTLKNLQLQQHGLNSKIQQCTQQLTQCMQHIETWQTAHPEFLSSVIHDCLQISYSDHQQMRNMLQQHHNSLESAKTAWQTLEEQYQKHLKQQPQLSFEDVESKLTALLAEKAQQAQRLSEIEAQLHIHANNQATLARYQTQIEEIKTEEYRWGRIYDLIGHKEGTKFKKIAQEHHLDILVEYANQQLLPLSSRYQLHRIPESLSLAIIDLDMNSEIRPVLSLSGGETFLVSLALALAIANMASGSMKLESLFIDEGFGTLDPTSLHMVMNALDHLQSQGRKVVLISHIQEMHERIPVQIQVNPVGAGASEINVVG